jgi:Rha family phage regulatory protein
MEAIKGGQRMNQLKIINYNGKFVADSREVAEMTNKEHSHLLRDIKNYLTILGKSNFGLADFFIESYYTDSQGKQRPHYYLTKKGCDMVANKMTGEKGVLFTAAYVTKFEEMEKQTSKPQSIEDLIIMQATSMKELRNEVSVLGQSVNTIKETIIQRDEDWRKAINKMFNKAVMHSGDRDFKALRNESYAMLEQRGHCKLNQRLRNLLDRLEQSGATTTQINNTSKMTVIENDPRLKEIYTSIVKEISIRYVAVV